MKNHNFWMIIGCGLPLLLIFFAPALGIGSGTSLFIFVLAMFACHLLMPMHGHGGHKHNPGGHTPETLSHLHYWNVQLTRQA